MMIRKFIVWGLETLCGVIDKVYSNHSHKLAMWSSQLDDRWGTQIWKEAE